MMRMAVCFLGRWKKRYFTIRCSRCTEQELDDCYVWALQSLPWSRCFMFPMTPPGLCDGSRNLQAGRLNFERWDRAMSLKQSTQHSLMSPWESKLAPSPLCYYLRTAHWQNIKIISPHLNHPLIHSWTYAPCLFMIKGWCGKFWK